MVLKELIFNSPGHFFQVDQVNQRGKDNHTHSQPGWSVGAYSQADSAKPQLINY